MLTVRLKETDHYVDRYLGRRATFYFSLSLPTMWQIYRERFKADDGGRREAISGDFVYLTVPSLHRADIIVCLSLPYSREQTFLALGFKVCLTSITIWEGDGGDNF